MQFSLCLPVILFRFLANEIYKEVDCMTAKRVIWAVTTVDGIGSSRDSYGRGSCGQRPGI